MKINCFKFFLTYRVDFAVPGLQLNDWRTGNCSDQSITGVLMHLLYVSYGLHTLTRCITGRHPAHQPSPTSQRNEKSLKAPPTFCLFTLTLTLTQILTLRLK